MGKIYRSALVNYSQQQMFNLVYGVDKYDEFLPWCAGGSFVEESADTVNAKIDIAYKSLNQSFSTRNIIGRPNIIHMELLDGPFKYLTGNWQFIKLATDKTRIEFDIDFEFKGFLLSKLATPVFEQIAGNMVNAFVKRAEEVYD